MAECKDCVHNKVCSEVNSLKCRKDFIWYDAKSGCPYYTTDVIPKSESLPLDVHEALKQHAVEEAKAEVAREIICEILLNHTPDIDGFFTIHKTELLKGE